MVVVAEAPTMRVLLRIVGSLCAVVGLVGLAVGAPQAQEAASPRPFGALHWRLVGPFRGGRTVAVAGVPAQPGVFYMAPNNGGVWKSIDYARTWNPIFDGEPTGSIGALAVAPSDPRVIYVGSGEGLRRPDLSTGDGMYRSSDGGRTWTHQGLRDGQQIAAIAVDPRDADRLYVAVLGHPFGANAERGLYRSTDGGASYHKVLGNGVDVGAVSVAIDPNRPDVVYAALWASRNGPWNLVKVYERQDQSGLYKSIDGGSTWSKLQTGLPTAVGRIGISVAPSDSQRIYAIVEKSADGCGVFRSDDAGASWKQTDTEERVCGRTEDFAGITADPRDRDTVYSANTTTYRSTDAGKSWVGIKGAPGGDDYHTVWIDPTNPNIILLGVDQGATLSTDRGVTWSSWYNQPTAQFYHVITDDRFPYRVFGGQQESGSAEVASRGNDGAISFREFHPVGVEEYGYVAPDPLHPWLIYGGKVSVYDERTGQTADVSPTYDRKRYRFDRTNPLVWNRVDQRTLYLGLNVVFATRDGGRTWRRISPDLTRLDPGEPKTLAHFAADDPLDGKHRGVIYSLAPSYLDPREIWAGTDDGLVWLTRDGGAHWRNVTPPGVGPWSRVTQIDASHFDRSTAYISVSRQRLDDLRPAVYRTHDGGASWQRIVSGIPADSSWGPSGPSTSRSTTARAGNRSRAISRSPRCVTSWSTVMTSWSGRTADPFGFSTTSRPCARPRLHRRVHRSRCTPRRPRSAFGTTPIPIRRCRPRNRSARTHRTAPSSITRWAPTSRARCASRSRTRAAASFDPSRAPMSRGRSIPRSSCRPTGSGRPRSRRRHRVTIASCGICTNRHRRRSSAAIRSPRSCTTPRWHRKASSSSPGRTRSG
jgi:photosystem II stability/assembly factor-like uncharacterized protein